MNDLEEKRPIPTDRNESRLDLILAQLQRERRRRLMRQGAARHAQGLTPKPAPRMILAIVLLVVTVASLGIIVSPSIPLHPFLQTSQGNLKAVLIDPLSTTDQDPQFISNITHTLKNAGYVVDYYGPDQATVGLFRTLAFQNYQLVIIRSHTAISNGIPYSTPYHISIVTSEPYTKSKYVYEQLVGQVEPAVVRPGNTYFAITPSFVQYAIPGNLRGTTVIEMGCSSLQGDHDIATSFIDKGASSFIGWDGIVSSWYTDVATQSFVSLIVHGQDLRGAVNNAAGPDPSYGGKLGFLDSTQLSGEEFLPHLTIIGAWVALLSVTLLVTRRIVKWE